MLHMKQKPIVGIIHIKRAAVSKEIVFHTEFTLVFITQTIVHELVN